MPTDALAHCGCTLLHRCSLYFIGFLTATIGLVAISTGAHDDASLDDASAHDPSFRDEMAPWQTLSPEIEADLVTGEARGRRSPPGDKGGGGGGRGGS